MLTLIKLEWQKHRIVTYMRNAFILAALLCLFIFAMDFLGIANDPDTGVPDTAPGMNRISATIELFANMSFLVFTGVMLSTFLVSPYRNGTIHLMFSYPIKRQKILAAQMLAVWIFNLAALVITKLLLYSCAQLGSQFMVPAFVSDFDMTSYRFYLQLILKSAVLVSMGFIALYAGMATLSSKVTIVTSFLLIFLTQANIGDITLSNYAAVPLLLTVISVLFAFLSLYRAETKDLP